MGQIGGKERADAKKDMKLTIEQKLEMMKTLVNHDVKKLIHQPHCERCKVARKVGTVIYCGCMKRATSGG